MLVEQDLGPTPATHGANIVVDDWQAQLRQGRRYADTATAGNHDDQVIHSYTFTPVSTVFTTANFVKRLNRTAVRRLAGASVGSNAARTDGTCTIVHGGERQLTIT